jgi:MscS family membrane protein
MFDLFNLPFLDQLPPVVREWTIRIILTLIIFGLVLLLRRVLTWIILAPFRALSKRTSTSMDNALLRIVEAASGYIVVAIALLLSTSVLSVGDVELVFIQNLARTLIIVGIGVALYQAIALLTGESRLVSATGLSVIDRELFPFIRTGLRIILIAVIMVIVIQEWGYNVSGLIAGLGLGGLAFSLAAQDTVSNLFGFSTIVGDRPFVVGEYIISPDAEGVVERVGVRSTRIRTLDQSLIVVPNNKLANSAITNWSRVPYRRFNFTIGVTYDTNSQQMRSLLSQIRELLEKHDLVQKDTIVVRFTEFSSSSLDILIRCNVNTPDWGDWKAEREQLNLHIMELVERMGLSMAFPSRSVYIESMPSGDEDKRPTVLPRPKPERRPAGPADQQQDEAGDAPTSGV